MNWNNIKNKVKKIMISSLIGGTITLVTTPIFAESWPLSMNYDGSQVSPGSAGDVIGGIVYLCGHKNWRLRSSALIPDMSVIETSKTFTGEDCSLRGGKSGAIEKAEKASKDWYESWDTASTDNAVGDGVFHTLQLLHPHATNPGQNSKEALGYSTYKYYYGYKDFSVSDAQGNLWNARQGSTYNATDKLANVVDIEYNFLYNSVINAKNGTSTTVISDPNNEDNSQVPDKPSSDSDDNNSDDNDNTIYASNTKEEMIARLDNMDNLVDDIEKMINDLSWSEIGSMLLNLESDDDGYAMTGLKNKSRFSNAAYNMYVEYLPQISNNTVNSEGELTYLQKANIKQAAIEYWQGIYALVKDLDLESEPLILYSDGNDLKEKIQEAISRNGDDYDDEEDDDDENYDEEDYGWASGPNEDEAISETIYEYNIINMLKTVITWENLYNETAIYYGSYDTINREDQQGRAQAPKKVYTLTLYSKNEIKNQLVTLYNNYFESVDGEEEAILRSAAASVANKLSFPSKVALYKPESNDAKCYFVLSDGRKLPKDQFDTYLKNEKGCTKIIESKETSLISKSITLPELPAIPTTTISSEKIEDKTTGQQVTEEQWIQQNTSNEVNDKLEYTYADKSKTSIDLLHLMVDDTQAKFKVMGEDYLIGPFRITYDTAKFDDVLLSWIDTLTINSNSDTSGRIPYKITNENKNGEFIITDKMGEPIYVERMEASPQGKISNINAPRNGEQFYVRCKYKNHEYLEDIDINVELVYFAGEKGGNSIEYDTAEHEWKYVHMSTSISSDDHMTGVYPNETKHCTDYTAKYNIVLRHNGITNSSYGVGTDDPTQPMVKLSTIQGALEFKKLVCDLYAETNHRTGDDDDGRTGDDDDDDDVKEANVEMEIAGSVWLDNKSGKSSNVDGELTSSDNELNGIEVWLYEVVKQPVSGANYFTTKDGKCLRFVDDLKDLNKKKNHASYSDKVLMGSNSNPQLTRRLSYVDDETGTTRTEDGRYSFKLVDPTKEYVVVFVYDGMLYTNTYGAGVPEYNTDAWSISSKATELVAERDNLNNRFITIGSYEDSYSVENNKDDNSTAYNQLYSVNDPIFSDENYLSEFNGKLYNKTYNLRGETVQYYKEKIRIRMQEYLDNAHKKGGDICNAYLKPEDYIKEIYQPILDDYKDTEIDKDEARNVLQFIWDCRINAYAGDESIQNGALRLGKSYPYFDKFILSKEEEGTNNHAWTYTNITGQTRKIGTYGTRAFATKLDQKDGYYYVYRGQLHINLGIVERPYTVLQVREDLQKSVVSINGKDETYKYSSLLGDDEKSVSVVLGDARTSSALVTGGGYTQKVAKEDYKYATTNKTKASELTEKQTAQYPAEYAPIQIYATYKIVVENVSGVKTTVNELVTYFDRHYFSYSDEYTTTAGNKIAGVYAEYYDNSENLKDSIGVKASPNSQFGGTINVQNNETTKTQDVKDLYLIFDKNDMNVENNGVMLDSKDQIRVYITYRLGEDSTSHKSEFSCTYPEQDGGNKAYNILQKELGKNNDKGEIKANTYVEINSYSTYVPYDKDDSGTRSRYNSENRYKFSDSSGNSYRAGGYLDYYSVAGNLDSSQIAQRTNLTGTGIKDDWGNVSNGIVKGSVSSIEFDWDKGAMFILIADEGNRSMSGNVWETAEKASAFRNADYPKYADSIDSNLKATGITVELVEISNKYNEGDKVGQIDETGTIHEYVRAITSTDENGKYYFEDYIPGDYVVRFTYGDKTDIINGNQYSKVQTYNVTVGKGTEGDELKTFNCAFNGQFYQSAKANPYTNTDANGNANKYWYNYSENDEEQNKIDRYSDASDEVYRRMYVNQLLSNSAKSGYTFADVASLTLHPTDYMVYAYTSLMNIEVEKAKTESYNSSQPGYAIDYIDFALTPRTPTKLNIEKEVSNIKLVLQNGTVKFDATPETIREQGVQGVVQPNRGDAINISMSSELINGATIEISYKITATNGSEYDSVTYFYDNSGKVVALSFYEEDVDKIVYYEDGKIRVHDNEGRHVNDEGETYTSLINAGTTETIDFNTSKKDIKVTTTTPSVVADFISNNLTFSKTSYTGSEINSYWKVYDGDKESLDNSYYKVYNNDEENVLGIKDLDSSEVYDNTYIVEATADNPLVKYKLAPGESSSAEIVLSKVISVERDLNDTKSYKNYVRVLEVDNIVSKVQDISYNGTDEKIRLKDSTNPVIISDPTGTKTNYVMITLILVAITIVAGGVILIKKFVLPRN